MELLSFSSIIDTWIFFICMSKATPNKASTDWVGGGCMRLSLLWAFGLEEVKSQEGCTLNRL